MKNHSKHCHLCDFTFERNNYYYGKLMTVRDFFAEQKYFNEKRWLINRMISGWGVVCGLEVQKKDWNTVIVKEGLAIDCCGREILVCGDQEVPLGLEQPECEENDKQENYKKKDKHHPEDLVICLDYHECKTEATNLPPVGCDQQEKNEFNRIHDSFSIHVRRKSDVDIEPPYGRVCPLEHKDERVHHYLCNSLKQCRECPEHPCVVLALIKFADNHRPGKPTQEIPEPEQYVKQSSDQRTQEGVVQDNPQQQMPEQKTAEQQGTEQKHPSDKGYPFEIDECSKRKFVYSNPLLYDLINCYHGDLPHVTAINWEHDNLEPIKWKEFEQGIYTEGFKIHFDCKIKDDTINKNTFVVFARYIDEDTGNSRYEQVPGDVRAQTPTGPGVTVAVFKFEDPWKWDTYFGYSAIRERGGKFLVLLRSDFILDVRGKALDGNFIGARFPSGNGTQGGDFISWFYVEAKPVPKKDQKKGRD